jgi:uncharacterized membrane protein YeaQ/YmgE (transglycosylase-associated protein family)
VFGHVGFFLAYRFERSCTMMLGVIGWIVLGAIGGFLASKFVNRRGEGLLLDIAIGFVGAKVGGWLLKPTVTTGATGFNAWSILVAIVGAVLMLSCWHLIRGPVAYAGKETQWKIHH